MLFDFHKSQNKLKPASVHACYLLDGIFKSDQETSGQAQGHSDNDTPMQSSPFMSSSMPQHEDEQLVIPVRRIVLVKEEQLNGEPFPKSLFHQSFPPQSLIKNNVQRFVVAMSASTLSTSTVLVRYHLG